MKTSENPSRQMAMVSGCACDNRTSGPANDTPMSARQRTNEGDMRGGWWDRRTTEVQKVPLGDTLAESLPAMEHANQTLRELARILPNVVDDRAQIGRQLVQPVVQFGIVE